MHAKAMHRLDCFGRPGGRPVQPERQVPRGNRSVCMNATSLRPFIIGLRSWDLRDGPSVQKLTSVVLESILLPDELLVKARGYFACRRQVQQQCVFRVSR
jgi:hypothetical protein